MEDGVEVTRLSGMGSEMRRRGRNLTAGQWERWTREYFEALGLHRLRGTVRCPERAFWETA